MHRSLRRAATASIVGVVLLGSAFAAPAAAKKPAPKPKPKPAVTKMTFGIADHDVLVGDEVSGTVRLSRQSGKKWAPLAGAPVTITVGGTVVDTATTDGAGQAQVSYVTTAHGEFAVKATFAGSSTAKRAQRAQGVAVSATWFADADADSFGDPAASVTAVAQPSGHVADSTDCDDTDAAAHPAAAEVEGNAVDDDCDGEVDETAEVVEPTV